MMLYQAGLGLAMPQAIAGALTPFPDHAGAASSLVGFMQQASGALLGAVVGHMLGFTAWPLAAAVGAMGCASLLLWMLCIRAGREGVREGILAAAFDPNQGKLQSPRNP
jgi:DHA1 family bicyclomycin/chloramphenicol resistance-like MFS transporter